MTKELFDPSKIQGDPIKADTIVWVNRLAEAGMPVDQAFKVSGMFVMAKRIRESRMSVTDPLSK